MKNILLTIRDAIPNIPTSEQKIAQTIINYPKEVINLSAKELARKASSSSSAVIRFCKSINVQSYTELKVLISAQLATNDVIEFTDINQNESLEETKEKLEMNISHFIHNTKDLLNEDLVYSVIHEIKKNDHIFVYGIGASGIIVKDIEQKFTRLGKHVISGLDQHEMVAMMSNNRKNSVFIAISASGKTQEVINITEVANYLGLMTISITENHNNPLSQTSRLSLKSASTDHVKIRSGATLSLINQLYLVGVIFYKYVALDYDYHMQKLLETKSSTDYLESMYLCGD